MPKYPITLFGVSWPSITEAAEDLGVTRCAISWYINKNPGKRSQANMKRRVERYLERKAKEQDNGL